MGSIHTFDPSSGCEDTTFQTCSDRALANHKAVVDSFRFYPINTGIPRGAAIAIGRYAEDVYFGGNPWYLTTLAAAEQLYDALYVWKQQGFITVTPTSLGFFRDLSPSVDVGNYTTATVTFSELFDAVFGYADGFLNVVKNHVESDGSMAEQFDKSTGEPRSARDLTWSYAAFLTAAARRDEVIPPSWGATPEYPLPSACSATSMIGTYSLATNTDFPPSQTPTSSTTTRLATTTSRASQTTSRSCVAPTSVAVTFHELAVTSYGDTIKLVGNCDALGNWDPGAGVPLEASEYVAGSPLWKTTLDLKAGAVIQYKYINVGHDGEVTWEVDPNHTYTVPASCATAVTRTDKWQKS